MMPSQHVQLMRTSECGRMKAETEQKRIKNVRVKLEQQNAQVITQTLKDSVTGEDVKRCPWLRKLPNQEKFICRIHDVKPEHCRAYPKSMKHALKTGCRGFEN